MSHSPYSKFQGDNLILRDELAIDRTLLSNERTLLSYLRAGVSLLLAGISIMHFLTAGWLWMVGVLSVPAGVIIGIIGVMRYRKMNLSISRVRRLAAVTPPAP